MERHHENIPT